MRTDEDEAEAEKNSLDVAESKEIIEAWQEEKKKRGTTRRAKQIKLFGEIYIINYSPSFCFPFREKDFAWVGAPRWLDLRQLCGCLLFWLLDDVCVHLFTTLPSFFNHLCQL